VLSWIITLFIVGLGAVLAFKRSWWTVDYAIAVFVFNRGLRRVLDWDAGAFNRLSPISLTPLIVCGLMAIPFLPAWRTLPQPIKTIFTSLGIATGYAFAIGFFRIQFGAVYALAEVITPVFALGFMVTAHAPAPVRDRWIRSAAWCAILASAYGWFQYLTIPPWDAFWVKSVGFVGYLGQLRPTEMTVFSTMAERGPLAAYLAFAVAAMILSPRWRTPLSWAGVVLVFSVLLLTLSRAGVIVATMAVFIHLFINRGKGGFHAILGMMVLFTALAFGMSRMPGAQRVATRFQTLGNMTEDGSFKGRTELRAVGLRQIVSNPLGYGLGATGIAGRVNTGSLEGQATIGDGGYFDIISTYGLIGSAFFFHAFWVMWKELSRRYRAGFRPGPVLLARTFLLVLIPATFVGNYLNGFSLIWIVFGAGLCPVAFGQFLRHRAASRKSPGPSALQKESMPPKPPEQPERSLFSKSPGPR